MLNSTSQKTRTEIGKFPQSSIQRNGKNLNSTSRPKGKSRFAQKSRGNPKAPVAVKRGPVKTYTSTCHGAPAKKPACVKVDKKKDLEQGLGKFRCTECGKRCTVTVSKGAYDEADGRFKKVTGEYSANSIEVLKDMPPAIPRPEAYVPVVPLAG